MDALFFFLGIFVIVTSAALVGTCAIYLHHRRAMENLRQREFDSMRKFQLMEKALDMGKLPPGPFKFD